MPVLPAGPYHEEIGNDPKREEPFIPCVAMILALAAAGNGPCRWPGPPPCQSAWRPPISTSPGVDGKNHTLDEYRNAYVPAIIFTCNHCPTAQAYEDRIKQLAADYQTEKCRPGGHLAQ